jgi:hypothetical protein
MATKVKCKKRGVPPFPRYSEETATMSATARKFKIHASDIAKAFPEFIHENTVRNKMIGRTGWASRSEFLTAQKIVNRLAESLISEIPA